MSERRSARVRARVACLAAVVALAGCDLGGPGGPARVAGTLTGNPATGAAVVEVTWPGVTGFEGRGGTQVYSGAVSGFPDRHRVILVDAAGGDLSFTIVLDDTRLDGPVLTVVSAVGTDNLPLDVTGLRVALER
jgi:hypothetical protein